ncbi:MAG: hypothetical protein ACREP9_14260, partial [Candidatus Dormibacteraceae bacterium]
MTIGTTCTAVYADPWEAVVETVVGTKWAAVGPAVRGGTPWTVGPGQAGCRRTRREAWDGFHPLITQRSQGSNRSRG